MIKQIDPQNIIITPFVAVKDWSLSSIQNDELVLIEQSASVQEIPVAMDYVDYASSYSFLNRDCNIALEQQEVNEVIYREGERRSGIFYPDIEPLNPDGTYKRLIYSQIEKAFYNYYGNFTQIFGIENVDFLLGRTERFLSEHLREFSVPQYIFGDKISKKSIQLVDNSLDDIVSVTDDGFGNLYAGQNLFSRIQEVRSFENVVLSGSASHSCSGPLYEITGSPSALVARSTASNVGGIPAVPYSMSLYWIDNSYTEDGFHIYRTVTTDNIAWTSWALVGTTTASIVTNVVYTDTISSAFISASYKVAAFNILGDSDYSNTSSVNISSSLLPP